MYLITNPCPNPGKTVLIKGLPRIARFTSGFRAVYTAEDVMWRLAATDGDTILVYGYVIKVLQLTWGSNAPGWTSDEL